MGKDIAAEIVQKWQELGPQIIELGKKEADNHWIQDLLKEAPVELSEGELHAHTNYIVHLPITVHRVFFN